MDNSQYIMYTIKKGDTLYTLAKTYGQTVSKILELNPHITNAHMLQIGTQIRLPATAHYGPNQEYNNKMNLTNDMRLAWEQHVYWTRLLLISIAERLNDLSATENRLLRNPIDIARIFNRYYSADVANIIEHLLTEHLQIGANLIIALRDNQQAQAAQLTKEWYNNADKMANAFSSINPYYNKHALQTMLYQHLDLTTQEVLKRLAGDYHGDIMAFDAVEQEALAMADMFTYGIMNQFPQYF